MSALSTKPILGRSIIVFQQGVSKEAETETADGRTRVLHCRHKRELSEFATRNSPVDMLWYPSSDCEAEATFLRSLIDRVSLQRLAVRIDLSQNLAELISWLADSLPVLRVSVMQLNTAREDVDWLQSTRSTSAEHWILNLLSEGLSPALRDLIFHNCRATPRVRGEICRAASHGGAYARGTLSTKRGTVAERVTRLVRVPARGVATSGRPSHDQASCRGDWFLCCGRLE
jgi:hypothetical protein